jgi:hypothetical protein
LAPIAKTTRFIDYFFFSPGFGISWSAPSPARRWPTLPNGAVQYFYWEGNIGNCMGPAIGRGMFD